MVIGVFVLVEKLARNDFFPTNVSTVFAISAIFWEIHIIIPVRYLDLSGHINLLDKLMCPVTIPEGLFILLCKHLCLHLHCLYLQLHTSLKFINHHFLVLVLLNPKTLVTAPCKRVSFYLVINRAHWPPVSFNIYYSYKTQQ